MSTRLKARSNRAKLGSVNFSRRLGRHTAIKKFGKKRMPEPCTIRYRAEFRSVGRRTIEYGTVAMVGTENTRTATPGIRALLAFFIARATG